MRGLIIRDPWIGLILQGKKTWEIRSKATSIRERIALIRGGNAMKGFLSVTHRPNGRDLR